MKIKIYDFEIEEDRSWYILREFWIMKSIKDWIEIERYWEKDIVYPSSLENCFKRILHTYKKNKDITVSLEQYIEEIKNINIELLNELQRLLWKK